VAKPTNKKKQDSSRLDEFERFRSLVRSEKNLSIGFRKYRKKIEPLAIFRTAKKFAMSPAYRGLLIPSPFPKALSHLPKNGFFNEFGYPNELAWCASFCSQFSAEIQQFLAARSKVELSFLAGDYSSIGHILTELEKSYGLSIWLIENQINLHSSEGGSASSRRYTNSLNLETAPVAFQYILSWLFYRCSSSVSKATFDKHLKEACPPKYGITHLTHLWNGSSLPITPEIAAQMLSFTDNFPIFDRYESLLATLQTIVASGTLDGSDLETTRSIVTHLLAEITDPRLTRLNIALGGQDRAPHFDGLLHSFADKTSSAESITQTEQWNVEKLFTALRAEKHFGRDLFAPERVTEKPNSILSALEEDIRHIVNLSDSAIDARVRLQKLQLTHANSSWASSLAFALARQINDGVTSYPTHEQRVYAFRGTADHPELGAFLGGADICNWYNEKAREQFPSSGEAVEAWSIVGNGGVSSSSISDNQIYQAVKQLRTGDIDGAIARLETFIGGDHGPYWEDASLLLVRLFLQRKSVAEASDIAANLFVASRYYGITLPVKDLISEILKEHDLPMSRSATRGKMSVAVIFDIYSRYISPDRDAERADAFKDVLRKEGKDRASLLGDTRSAVSIDLLIYFLRFVCVPDVLDQSTALTNTREVEDERAAILVLLSNLFGQSGKTAPATLKDELREIRTRQVVRETTLRLDQSKIYVNVDGIRRALDVVLRESWTRYQHVYQDDLSPAMTDLERLMREVLGDKLKIVQLDSHASDARSLFREMIVRLRDEFTLNKEFGLNSNLSTNIRHGYVLREIRSPLTARNLITNKDSDSGSYRKSTFWIDRLPEHSDERAELLSSIISEFSAAIDEKIDHLNRRLLRIRSEANPEGLFNYDLSEAAMAAVMHKWSLAPTYDEFLDTVFGSFWDATESNLARIRRHLKGPFLKDLNEIVGTFESSVEKSRLDVELPSLKSAIMLVRSEIRSAVERVENWFTLSGNNEYPDFELEIAFKAGIQTVKTYYKNVDIVESYRTSGAIPLRGWCLPMFARLFFLVLDNAAMHGAKNRENLVIEATAELTSDILSLKLRNDLDEKHDRDEMIKIVSGINSEYGKERAMDLLGEEGGSGYPKIWKLLKTDLNRSHDLSVSYDGNHFDVEIVMNTHGIV
jgi:hypothetical protein